MALDALQAALGSRGQWLSLDPAQGGQATVGGVHAAKASGPRRHLYGASRDLLLVIVLVLADGSVVGGEGKVVQHVAGYDLPKLAIGSFGTLGVIAEATFKLRPRPEAERLLVLVFGRLKDAGQAARAIMGSDVIPNAVELLDRESLARLEAGLSAPLDGGALAVGLDGTLEQVAWQAEEVPRLVACLGAISCRALDGEERARAWAALAGLSR